MSHNSFGHLFRVTTWGESHGPAIGCVVDGCPPGLNLDEAWLQHWLDRRKPGGSRFVTQRREPDTAQIQSGVFEGRTTGAPIGIVIQNQDTRSKDYDNIKDVWRPGHADYSWDMKYGIGVRDHRGGGRSSARETAMRVAAGGVARRVLGDGIVIRAAVVQIGPRAIDRARWDWAEIENNPFWCPDAETAKLWEADLDAARESGSSLGAIVEVVAEGAPAGWGAPVYAKLDADMAAAMMSIPAVKGVEIGAGFEAASLDGRTAADEMASDGKGGVRFLGNRNGGVLGGVSTGQDIVCRFAVKPTSSIHHARRTLDRGFEETTVQVKGRHDPCVGIRAAPVAEAMMALVLTDHKLRHRGQVG